MKDEANSNSFLHGKLVGFSQDSKPAKVLRSKVGDKAGSDDDTSADGSGGGDSGADT